MPTPFTSVYKYFLAKVTDYKFIALNDSGDLDAILFNHLVSAIVQFPNCNQDLEDIDETNNQFNISLSMSEKEILSMLMVMSYLNSKILDVKNMSKELSDLDYKAYSSIKNLSGMIQVKSSIQLDINNLMNIYSLKNGLGDFK